MQLYLRDSQIDGVNIDAYIVTIMQCRLGQQGFKLRKPLYFIEGPFVLRQLKQQYQYLANNLK